MTAIYRHDSQHRDVGLGDWWREQKKWRAEMQKLQLQNQVLRKCMGGLWGEDGRDCGGGVGEHDHGCGTDQVLC